MTILESELKAYYPATISDATGNGGRITANAITPSALQNVFPHVFKAERLAGSTKHRKLFFRAANDADETLFAPSIHFHRPTIGGDWCYFRVGSQRDTQGDLTGSERKYGAGTLKTTVTAGGSTLVVTVEDASLTGMFVNGDKIRLTDKLTPGATLGNEEELTISGAPSVSGVDVTITTTETLANGYTGGSAWVSSIYYPATDLACTVDNWAETSAAGTYDETTYPVITDNIGTVEQTWTLTFTDATSYTVVGDTLGSVGSGTTAADFAPSNPAVSKPYFTIESAGWGGTWALNETIVWQTHPNAIPIWETRVVPAGAGSQAGNGITAVFEGETA
ncbi:MAG: hypothetical protein M0P26_02595 [Bacteroidales bacterium]|jgi:hypothetical protein|nr:hypothetical protein [Bacteroidales bacterium]MDX9738626.1 hypothetical protein [Azonexus sp.]